MTEGTKSVLFGCHSIIHSYYVIKAWKKLNKHFPRFWQIICILVHDIGHVGLNYLSDDRQKELHWILGAQIAQMLFGKKGFLFNAGHTKESGYPLNKVFKIADKYSYVIAPNWWIKYHQWVEGFDKVISVEGWKNKVRENLFNHNKDNHQLYLEVRRKKVGNKTT